jgi:hypothetical protein
MTRFTIPVFAFALVIAPSLSLADTNSSPLTVPQVGVRSQQSNALEQADNPRVPLYLQGRRAMNPFHGGSSIYYGGLAARLAQARRAGAHSIITGSGGPATFKQSKNLFHGGTSIYYGALAATPARVQSGFGLASRTAARPAR